MRSPREPPRAWMRRGIAASSPCRSRVVAHRGASRRRSPRDRVCAIALATDPKTGAAHGKRFVDIQDDVTVDDIVLAHRESFLSVEHLKRYTTLGMGTDQGKTSNVNGLAILAALRNEPIPAVGTTTFRPPYTPVDDGTLRRRRDGARIRRRRG